MAEVKRKKLVCIKCPNGCIIDVSHDGQSILAMDGNKCEKGNEYALSEIFHPERIVTTTVKITGARIPLLPVKTSRAVPRELCFSIIAEAAKISAVAPVRAGEILASNISGSGADLVSTRSLPKK